MGGNSTGTGGAEGGQGGSGADGGAGSGGTPPACDPREEDCTDQVAFHVSPLGDDGANGAKETPLKTVSYALGRVAQRSPTFGVAAIYVCATEGAYEETLSIGPEHNGVGLFGGFDCESFEPIDERTEIVAATPAGHRIEGAEGITLGDLHLRSPDATEPGESSFGLWVVESDDVKVVRSEVEAGAGAPGAAGEGYDAAAEAGAAGKPGVNACLVDSGPNFGGSEAVTVCGGLDTASIGGLGGPGGGGGLGTNGGSGDAGQPDGGTTGTTQPGAAGVGEGSSLCTPGQPGVPGSHGTHGAVAEALGTLTADGYVLPEGGDGTTGTIGKGGGGGGGAAKPADVACPTGASGGSGGGGGCPGAGAKGGRGGGTSLGVVSFSSIVTLESVTIRVSGGGDGGVGGDGQEGGPSGDGGSRGSGASGGNDACRGGDGGRGGNGGSGAGGPGGPSIGVAHVGTAPLLTEVGFELPDDAAVGGPGGVLHETAGEGPTGAVEQVLAF